MIEKLQHYRDRSRLFLSRLRANKRFADVQLCFPNLLLGTSIEPKRIIYIVSIPRGGSSWVGKTFGQAPASLYLREPITQSYRQLDPDAPACYELSNCKHPEELINIAQCAFDARPFFDKNIVHDRQKWRSLENPESLVIKEVNPLLLPHIISKHSPTIIYLLRHPAAVALSMVARGWTRDPFEGKFTSERLKQLSERHYIPEESSYWERHGAFQAITQQIALDTLSNYSKSTRITYEQVCAAPNQSFKSLFEFCGLEYDDHMEKLITSDTNADSTKYQTGRYDTKRDSKSMIDKWRDRINGTDLEQLKQGYLKNDPKYYTSSNDW